MGFKDELILLLKKHKIEFLNDICRHAPYTWGGVQCLVLDGSQTQICPALTGRLFFFLYVAHGDGATRLCPGLLCVGLSGRQNVQTPEGVARYAPTGNARLRRTS